LGLPGVTAMLFVSGSAALIFQVAWMRELRLVFGATTAAAAAVLAIFMAGLGLGSAVLGPRADRSANPLRLYGQLEVIVALAVAASPFLVSLAASFYFALGGQFALGVGGATVVRLLLAMLVLGVPTFVMGGTLPAAVRSVTAVGDQRRRALAVLYGVNTLGAVCGTFVATFFALETLGTRATLWFGCAMNLLIGLAAIRFSQRIAPSVARPDLDRDATPTTEGSAAFVYLTAAVLGFTFFTLELVWYRMLGPILGGTTFTFGLILCVALLGIGLGSTAYHLLFRWVRPSWSILALTCAAEAVCAALPLALGDRLAIFAGRWSMYSYTFPGLVAGWFAVMVIVVFPVALVSGLQFPLLVAMLGQGRTGVSRQLGMTYAWNTLGAIAGSLVGGFGALPLLTAPGAWRAVVLLLVALAAIQAARSWRSGGWTHAAVAALMLLAVVFAWQQGPTAVWRHGGIGAGRAAVPPPEAPNAVQMWLNELRRNLVWEAEGVESSIGITAPDGLSFIVNGKNDGNAIADAGTQIGVAVIGAALHPEPKTGLVIGLGTGESAGWLASMPTIERVDVVELEPAIDEMAQRSSGLNHDVLNHPKVRRIYDDGREFVLSTDEKYDLIISEPSNPYRAGVASLYTQEFYRAVRERLTPDGIFIQWVQAYEVDGATVHAVLATARTVFDHVEVWQSIPSDLQLICSQQPIRYSAEQLRARVAEPALAAALKTAWRVEGLEGFLSHFLGNDAFVDELTPIDLIVPNTDDRNYLEYGFAKTVGRATEFSGSGLRDAAVELGRHRPEIDDPNDSIDWDLVERSRIEFAWLFGGSFEGLLKGAPELRALAVGYAKLITNEPRQALEEWKAAGDHPLSEIDRLVRAQCHAQLSEEECLKLLAPIDTKYPAEAAAIRATYYWKQEDAARAAAEVKQVFQRMAEDPWAIAAIVRPVLIQANEIVQADPTTARPIFDLLSQPFAGMRLDQQRKLLRLMVAEQLGDAEVVEALSDLEPHPLWTEKLLKLRAAAYRRVDHPLAEQAERDWQRYLRAK
jgi:predicted membrane-bound spermidine synthase